MFCFIISSFYTKFTVLKGASGLDKDRLRKFGTFFFKNGHFFAPEILKITVALAAGENLDDENFRSGVSEGGRAPGSSSPSWHRPCMTPHLNILDKSIPEIFNRKFLLFFVRKLPLISSNQHHQVVANHVSGLNNNGSPTKCSLSQQQQQQHGAEPVELVIYRHPKFVVIYNKMNKFGIARPILRNLT